MSPNKRSDAKNYLESPLAARFHLVQPESQPDATGFSGTDPETAKAARSSFSKDFVGDHSSSDIAVAPTDPVTGSIGQQALPESKCAQA